MNEQNSNPIGSNKMIYRIYKKEIACCCNCPHMSTFVSTKESKEKVFMYEVLNKRTKGSFKSKTPKWCPLEAVEREN